MAAGSSSMHDDVPVSRVKRTALTGGALLIAAWFVLGWVQARDAGRADALLSASSSHSSTQAAEIRSLLNSAQTLNPDRTIDLFRARLDLHQHEYANAIRILAGVTHSEPLDVFAWSQLGFTAGAARQFPVAERALRHVKQLVPPIN